jgi:hypothetical protein
MVRFIQLYCLVYTEQPSSVNHLGQATIRQDFLLTAKAEQENSV